MDKVSLGLFSFFLYLILSFAVKKKYIINYYKEGYKKPSSV
jgi:hypothetical protein